MKRVLILYEGSCGGETIATKNIVNGLSRYKSFRIRSHELNKLEKTSFLGYFEWLIKSVLTSIKILIRSSKADIIYVTTFTAGIAAVLLKRLYGYKLIFHYHGSRLPEDETKGLILPRKISQKFKFYLTYIFHRAVFNRCKYIIVPAKNVNNLIADKYNLDGNNIKVINNGIDLSKFKAGLPNKKLKLKEKYRIPMSDIVILYSGRFDTKKNIIKLIGVFRILADDIPNICLVLAHLKPEIKAEKEYFTLIQSEILKSGISDKVILLENKPMDEVYQIADLAISLSSIESLSLFMLESFACELPFMASFAGASDFLKQIDKRLIIIKDNDKSIANAIKQMVCLSTKELKSIKKRESNLAKNFSIEKKIEEIALLFNTVDQG